MKKLLLTLVLMLPMMANAYDAKIDGIYYNFAGNEAEVTRQVGLHGGIVSYTGFVDIPETVTWNSKTYTVTSVGSYAFNQCTGLTSVTIPNSVTSIGNYAFAYCYSLTSVTIPNSVTLIGNSAFQSCYALTSVTIPNSVTSIAGGAFNGCSGLTSITIPNSVTSIGPHAFSSCI
ncbi:MAG: leucine-rich repeat domain-containing protein [Bacteroidaceae bacterium]|nr:leucine-rich repeat domain-containing protein [Bacteroidaceae bacterium]